jgi:histidyl-tRNA synthetase
LIGTNSPEAIAELIALAYHLLINVGVKDIKLIIGNLNVLSSILDHFHLSRKQQDYLLPLIDKSLDKDLLAALIDFGISDDEANNLVKILNTSGIEQIMTFTSQGKNIQNEIDTLNEVLQILKTSFHITDFQIKFSIVRGLDYYRGIVFEIESPSLGAEKQLCGGGLYDLVTLFGGKETPTAGFAIGFDRTLLALESESFNFPKTQLMYYLIPVTKDMISIALQVVQELRKKYIPSDIDLLGRNLVKSLKYAGSVGAKKVIIIGPKEQRQGCILIRNMITGEQKLLKLSDFFKAIHEFDHVSSDEKASLS